MACAAWWGIQITLSGKGELNEGRVAYYESAWLGLAFPLSQLMEESAWCVSTGSSET